MEELIVNALEAEADPNRHCQEKAILATIIKTGVNGDFALEVFRTPEEVPIFSRSDCKLVWRAVWRSIADQIPFDRLLIADQVGSDPEGIVAAVFDQVNAVEIPVAREYVKRITAIEKKRALVGLASKFAATVDQVKIDQIETDPGGCFNGLIVGLLDQARGRGLVREEKTESETMPGFLAELGQRRQNPDNYLGLDCGFKHMNEVFNGLRDRLYILAGAPSTGKTTFAKQIADQVAKSAPVLFITFEQSAEELRIKTLSRLSNIDSRLIEKGRTDQFDWSEVVDAAEVFRSSAGHNLKIIEAGRADTVDQIKTRSMIARQKANGPILVIIDYLQLIPGGPGAPDTVRERVDFVLSELCRMVRDIKSPVLVISALNRQGYAENKRPSLASLKESGGIDYSADSVLALWREKESYQVNDRFDNDRKIRVKGLVLKNRSGELATLQLDFMPAKAKFDEVGKDDLEWSAALGE